MHVHARPVRALRDYKQRARAALSRAHRRRRTQCVGRAMQRAAAAASSCARASFDAAAAAAECMCMCTFEPTFSILNTRRVCACFFLHFVHMGARTLQHILYIYIYCQTMHTHARTHAHSSPRFTRGSGMLLSLRDSRLMCACTCACV